MHQSPATEPSRATPLVVLVDDTRAFRERRPHLQVRRGGDAVDLLRAIGYQHIDELWLDYDLLDGTTSAAAVEHLVARAGRGTPLPVRAIEVHSARVPEALHITQRLRRAGYRARRCYTQGIWARFDAVLHDEWRPRSDGGISDGHTQGWLPTFGFGDLAEGLHA